MKRQTLIPLFETLESQRLAIRPYRPEDAAALQAGVAESREHLRDWLPFYDAHQTVEESRDWLIRQQADWLRREDFGCGIFRRDDGHYLGGIDLHPRNWEIGFFEIGYWLRASATGQGYMTEAVRLLAAFALESFDAKRVEIRCSAHNLRSTAVARSAGFTYEGTLRNDHLAMNGQISDSMVFSLVPDLN